MSFETTGLNTDSDFATGSTDRLYHLEKTTDWEGREVDVPVYDIPVDVRIAMAQTRLARERPSWVMPAADLGVAA